MNNCNYMTNNLCDILNIFSNIRVPIICQLSQCYYGVDIIDISSLL
ncbi:15862_t:CDS:2 [Dentiscutata heterogama]|uniref:15862_t:CDS:1 n=1 Tax=Dentiscutata heterogama TaxID=1316150 RepID=A0ACA9JV76_9GLOM|nr:15862_t:CDS:2 [Dentiscutata heterogama]